VSGADENVIRVFHAPKNFLRNFSRLCHANVTDELKKMVRGAACALLCKRVYISFFSWVVTILKIINGLI